MQYLEICLLTTKALGSFNFLFFRVLLLPQQNEIQLVSRFFLSSKPFGPGNWIQSLAMPISVMNARGELPYKSDGKLVVSLWGVNRRFWTHLGCLGGKFIIWFRYRLVLCITKNALTLTTQKSPLAVSLSLSQTYIGLSLGFYLNFPTRFPVTYLWESSPAMNVNSLSCIFVMN